MPPAVVAALPMVISGIGAVGGLFSGKKAADSNQSLINGQNQQLLQQTQMAQRLASSVNRADYEQMASQDSRAALRDVFAQFSSRGLGRSTAAMTASSQTSGAIQSAYGKQYLSDRLSSISGAAGIFGQAAGAPRMGYDSDPYAGFRSGLGGLASGAAYMQSKPGTPAPMQSSGTDPYFRTRYNPSFG